MAAARNTARPADLTGKIKAEQAAANADALKARAGEIALINAAAEEEKSEVVDLTAGPTTSNAPDVVEVELAEKVATFRVNTDLENTTIGKGNDYTFEVGRTYKAPQHVYDHLEEIGYIWH